MKKYQRIARKAWWGALAAVCLVCTSIPVAFAQSQTAQSIMVSVTPSTTAIEIVGDITWTFDRDGCAVNYYTAGAGVWNGSTPTCTGSTANCASSNQPSTPSALAPLIEPIGHPDSVKHHAQADRCIFFCGGDLPYWSYTQTKTVTGLNGKGNWTFTYNYDTTAPVVEAKTCWTSEVTGGTAEVTYDGFASSESCVKKTGGSWQRKYSFTLLNSDGTSRVVDVSAQLQKETPTGSGTWVDVGSPTVFTTPLPVSSTVADYSYFGNGGVFGNSAVFFLLHGTGGGKTANFVTNILNGTSDGLAADNFSGNNNDLLAWNVHQADFDGSYTFGIGDDGNYRVAITGTLKDNTASGVPDANFSVATNLVIIGGCECP